MKDLRHRLIQHGIDQATPWSHEQRAQRRRDHRYNTVGAIAILAVLVFGFYILTGESL